MSEQIGQITLGILGVAYWLTKLWSERNGNNPRDLLKEIRNELHAAKERESAVLQALEFHREQISERHGDFRDSLQRIETTINRGIGKGRYDQ